MRSPTKAVGFSEKRISKWSELHRFRKPGWMFRGEREERWPLRTSIDRCLNPHRIPNETRVNVENELIREFRRAFHHYSDYIPHPDNTIEWLSLMQHHGAPTRLLDFTYSIYIAAYFATEKAERDSAILAIRTDWAMNESMDSLRKSGKAKDVVEKLDDRFNENDEQVVNKLFWSAPATITACPINPFRLNERLRIQKGLFLMQGSVEVDMAENLKAMKGFDDENNVVRIIISKTAAASIRQELFDLNTSRRTLFPGLDGYAAALGIFHPVFDPKDPLHKRLVR